MPRTQTAPTQLDPWYVNEAEAARDAVKVLSLKHTGNAGGWLTVYGAGDSVLFRSHGYHGAWPILLERFRDKLNPLPLIGHWFPRRFRCSHCAERRSAIPERTLAPCECGQGEWVPMCGCCHWEPALPGRLVGERCQHNEHWQAFEAQWRERIGEIPSGAP